MSTQDQLAGSFKATELAAGARPGEDRGSRSVGLGHPGDTQPGDTQPGTSNPVLPVPPASAAASVIPSPAGGEPDPYVHVGWAELALGAFALAAWFVLFGGGILVATGPHRDRLTGGAEFLPLLGSALVVLAFWTITNVGILCCLSAFLGAVGRRTRFAVKADACRSDGYVDLWPARPAPMAAHYASAIMRGFGIYGVVMAGLLVLATESFTDPTQGGYVRLASTVSVLSFYAGYDPELFAGVLDRVKTLLGPPPGKAG